MNFDTWCTSQQLSEKSRHTFAGYILIYSSIDIDADYQAIIWQDAFFDYLRWLAQVAGSEA
jgi:hypothetical protein